MKSALEVYEKFLNAITKAVGVIAGILLLLPALMVFYEVVMRGLFNAPTEWSIELSVYCVLVAGFLGMSVTYAAGKHIHVDIVLSHLSARTRCYIELFTTIVGIFFCAVFVMQSLDMALLSYEMDNTSPSTLQNSYVDSSDVAADRYGAVATTVCTYPAYRYSKNQQR